MLEYWDFDERVVKKPIKSKWFKIKDCFPCRIFSQTAWISLAWVLGWLFIGGVEGYADTRFITLVPSKATVAPGEDVEISVTISDAKDIRSYRVGVAIPNLSADYPFAFITDSITGQGTLTSAWDPPVQNDLSTSRGFIVAVSVAGQNPPLSEGPGTLLKFKLYVKPDAKNGSYALSFQEGITRMNDGVGIVVSTINASITIGGSAVTPGTTPTYSPTPLQTPKITPTGSGTPVVFPTNTPTVTPTPTLNPNLTPAPTNTRRPGNHPPTISIIPQENFYILKGQELIFMVIAFDQDAGDLIQISLSPNALAAFKSNESVPQYTLTEYVLDSSQLGDYSFVVYAYDGSDVSQKNIFYSVVNVIPAGTMTPYPTPTSRIPAGTPTRPVMWGQNPVIVTDDENSMEDLSGRTDFDTVDNRKLTIRWNQPVNGATDWHVYVKKGLGGKKYLGHTGSGSIQQLSWYPFAPLISPEFSFGPDFNFFYSFRVIRVDGNLSSDDYFDQILPVGLSIEGTNPVKITNPEYPNIVRRKISIYDDILGGDDLAPMVDVGMDVDQSYSRAILIAWNFELNPIDVIEYHIQVRTDNRGDFEYLGQTYDNRINYFWWTPNDEFSTNAKYAEGPQNGKAYQFRVVMVPMEGDMDSLTSGTLYYYVRDTYPIWTPSPIPQATATPTATPTLLPPELPYHIVPQGTDGKTIKVTLPGLTKENRPLELVLVKLGDYTMGSPDDERGRDLDEIQHPVEISRNYFIGKYEITQAQWRTVMLGNPSWFSDDLEKPVETVSWNDCQTFIAQLNYKVGMGTFRLPTEAEWEYACRSGATGRFSFGEALNCSDEEDVFCEEMDGFMWWLGNNTYETNEYGTKRVGLKKPNALGLYDMHGNVFEWCQDWYGVYPSILQSNPVGPFSGTFKVIRGGSWSSDAADCRSAKRFSQLPDNRFVTIGFRIVWQVE